VYTVHLSIYMLGCRLWWSGPTAFFSFNMSFLLRKVEDVTTISKSQSLTSVSIKRLHLESSKRNYYIISFTSDNKSNLHSSCFWICTYIFMNIEVVWLYVFVCICTYTCKFILNLQTNWHVRRPIYILTLVSCLYEYVHIIFTCIHMYIHI